jgi:hypothetical protein
MLKRLVLFLLMLSPFMFSSAWADRVGDIKVLIINDMFKFYEGAAESVVKEVQKNGVEVERNGTRITIPKNQVLEDVINLGKQAQE